jgi:hypothetical protein
MLGACHAPNSNEIVSIRKGDTIIKGDIKGTYYNDTVRYYDLQNELIQKSYFANGKKEGKSFGYYRDGKLMTVCNYDNGLKNGYNSYYDQFGNCYYRDFYYYDLVVGPVSLFENDGNPKLYYFINLQNETLLKIDYRDWGGIKDVYSSCINFTYHMERVGTTHELAVLLYLMNPPRFSFEYSILKKKATSDHDFTLVMRISNNFPFKNVLLSAIDTSEQYTVGLQIYDSLLHKHTSIYKDLISSP